MPHLKSLAVRSALRLVALALVYLGVTEVQALAFIEDPEVIALVSLGVAEAFFYLQKGWDWIMDQARDGNI